MSDPRDQLDMLLPPDPGAGRTDPLPAIPAGAVLADLPRHLRDRLDEAPGADRSAQTAGLVAAAVEWGLDDGEVVAVAMAHRPTREKYGKRVEREAVRLLGKFRPDHQHVGRPCDRAGCPNAPRWMTGLGPGMVEGKTEGGGLVEGSSSVGEQSEFGEQRSAEADDPAEGPGLSSPDSLSSPSREETWPMLDPAALHGLAGRLVATLGPHTEADPAALLLSFLVAFGNAVGPGPRALVGATEHPARLNLLLVGQTARARKGTAQAEVNKIMALADPGWFAERVVGGLASGEGLIATVRDPADDEDTDAPADKRLLCVEAEFVRVLGVAAREGNTLSAVLRQAWDDGRLRTMTRKDPLRASGAHISIIGHITAEELLRRLGDTEIANGFVNRFLLAAVRRSKRLPEGGSLDPAALDELAADVAEALGKARKVGTVTRSPGARERWAKAYEDFGDGADGLAGALTARPEAQTLRLSVAYALLDGSAVVELPHLEAALAVWRYCEASAYVIFGDLLGDPVADRLLDELRQAGPEGLDGAAQHAVFARKVTATRLAQARALLEGKGLVSTTSEKTRGRDRLVTRINRRDNR